MLFPYAPNSVILGFIFTTIGSIIGMLISPVTGYFVIPGVMSNFFAGGTAGIFGNAVGGRRGLIIGCIVHGIFIMLMPALLTPMLSTSPAPTWIRCSLASCFTASSAWLGSLPSIACRGLVTINGQPLLSLFWRFERDEFFPQEEKGA